MKLKALLYSLVAVILFSSVADAQLFRRNVQRSRTVSVQSNCPGGVCPTRAPVRQIVRAATLPRLQSASHWSYPGAIDSHLQSTHAAELARAKVSINGMSREQMLSTHDAIHEGRLVPSVAPVLVPIVAPAVTPAPASIMQRSSSETFGLVGDYTPVEIPKHVLAQFDDDKPVEVAASFRATLAKAIVEARKSGKINAREAVRLRIALASPAFVQAAHGLAVTQVAFNGDASEFVPVDADGVIQAEGIDWEGLIKFLEALVPLLMTLLKLFGV